MIPKGGVVVKGYICYREGLEDFYVLSLRKEGGWPKQR